MFNFLYCFDSNYNIPGSCSIYSLLENVSEKINIYIMHKDFDNASEFSDKIKNHKNTWFLHFCPLAKPTGKLPGDFWKRIRKEID